MDKTSILEKTKAWAQSEPCIAGNPKAMAGIDSIIDFYKESSAAAPEQDVPAASGAELYAGAWIPVWEVEG